MFKKIINRANVLIGLAFVLLIILDVVAALPDVLAEHPNDYFGAFLYMFFPLFIFLTWLCSKAYKSKKDHIYKVFTILFAILGTLGFLVFIVCSGIFIDELAFVITGFYILYKSYNNGKKKEIHLLVELTYLMYFILFALVVWGAAYTPGGFYVGEFDLRGLIIALGTLSVFFVDNKFFKFYDRVMTPKEDKKETKKEEVNEEKEEEEKVQKKPRTKKK